MGPLGLNSQRGWLGFDWLTYFYLAKFMERQKIMRAGDEERFVLGLDLDGCVADFVFRISAS